MTSTKSKREVVARQSLLLEDRFIDPLLRLAGDDPIVKRHPAAFVEAPPPSEWRVCVNGVTSRLGDVRRGERLPATDPRVAAFPRHFLDVGDQAIDDVQAAGLMQMLVHNSARATERRHSAAAERREQQRRVVERHASGLEAEAARLTEQAQQLRSRA